MKQVTRALADAAPPLPRVSPLVVLRRLGVEDVAAFQAYRNDAELGRYQGWSAMTDADALAFLQDVSGAPLFRPGHWSQIAIAEPGARMTLLGDIGLFLAEDSCHAEIGFTLARAAQGRGLATAAVNEALQLVFECSAAERVLGITDARNHASMRLLERVGMVQQHKREVEFRGEPCIEVVYAVYRSAARRA